MKLAVCLRGHIRNAAARPFIDNLKNVYGNVDIYVHTFDKLHPVQPHNIENYVEGEVLPHQIEDWFSPKKYVIEQYDGVLPYIDNLSETLIENWFTVNEFNNPVTKESVIRRCFFQLYKTACVVDLIDNITDYDCILITRPDVEFRFNMQVNDLNNESVFISGNIRYERMKDSTGKFTGVWCDDLVRVGTPHTITRLAESCKNIKDTVLELREKNYFEIAGDTHKIQAYVIERVGLHITPHFGIYSQVLR